MRKEQSAWRKALKVSRRQPSGRYALCALHHAIIHLRLNSYTPKISNIFG